MLQLSAIITNLYAANNVNQNTNIKGGTSSPPLSYDLDGNMLTNSNWTYKWNGGNRMILASNDQYVIENIYDYMGRRILKTVSTYTNAQWQTTSETRFIWDGWNVISETQVSGLGTQVSHYVWGLDLSGTLKGAGGVGGLLCVTECSVGSMSQYFPAYDANGNITDYVDTNGTIVARYDYDPFGNITQQSGTKSAEMHYRFSTKYLDAETGFYYYGYRFYSPELGRWLSRDPVGDESFLRLQLTNLDRKERRKREKQLRGAALKPLYLYVDNRPISEIDPLGLDNPGGGGQNQVCCATSPGSGGSSGPSAACSACANAVGANVLLQLAQNGIDGTDDAGGGNAFRHCLAACQTSRACGSDCARSFWDCRENPNDPAGQQDLANNQVGYGIQGSCWDGCNNAWDNGQLNCQGQPCPPR